MKLSRQLTTVTPFSKLLAMVIFIIFPFVGFYFGMIYQKGISTTSISSQSSADEMANWKTYTNAQFKFSFEYPDTLQQGPKGREHILYGNESKSGSGLTRGSETKGIEIGSVVYGPNEDLENYKTGKLYEKMNSFLKLPNGVTAKTYTSESLITSVIYYKLNRVDMRIMIWCSGDYQKCQIIFPQILSTFKFTN